MASAGNNGRALSSYLLDFLQLLWARFSVVRRFLSFPNMKIIACFSEKVSIDFHAREKLQILCKLSLNNFFELVEFCVIAYVVATCTFECAALSKQPLKCILVVMAKNVFLLL